MAKQGFIIGISFFSVCTYSLAFSDSLSSDGFNSWSVHASSSYGHEHQYMPGDQGYVNSGPNGNGALAQTPKSIPSGFYIVNNDASLNTKSVSAVKSTDTKPVAHHTHESSSPATSSTSPIKSKPEVDEASSGVISSTSKSQSADTHSHSHPFMHTSSSPEVTGSTLSNLSRAVRSFSFHGFANLGALFHDGQQSTKYPVAHFGDSGSSLGVEPTSFFDFKFVNHFSSSFHLMLNALVENWDTRGVSIKLPDAGVVWMHEKMKLVLGRYFYPGLLYSDNYYDNATQAGFYLPTEVYGLVPFTSINGVKFGHDYSLRHYNGGAGFAVFAGFNDANADLGSGVSLNTNGNLLVGSNVFLTMYHVTYSASFTHDSMKGDRVVSGVSTPLSDAEKDAEFFTGSAHLEVGHWDLSGEYIHNQMPRNFASKQAYDFSAAYAFPHFKPRFTYSRLTSLNAAPVGYGSSPNQRSYTLSTGIKLPYHLSFAANVSYVDPDAGSSTLGDATKSFFNFNVNLRNDW